MTVGRAIAGRRDDAFVATKMTPATPTPSTVEDHGRLSALRLQIDRIDLYQLHWPNPVIPLSAQMEGMRRLLDENVITNVGVSNYPTSRWAAAEQHLGKPVLSNQVQYSLLWRRAERDKGTVPYAQTHDRLIIAYSPLAKGLLGGRYSPDHLPSNSARSLDPLCLRENVERAMPVIEAAKRVAAAHGATPAQVSLAWLISRPNVVAIPGASSIEQLKRNVEAADLDLTNDELAELTAASDAFEPLAPPQTALAMLRARRHAA
jgi:aryl-alcohol dehydrogenase-like predicted oxidoreductase